MREYAGALVEVLQRPAAPTSQPANDGGGEAQAPTTDEGEPEAGDVNGATNEGSGDSPAE